jgi:hypothetical protein
MRSPVAAMLWEVWRVTRAEGAWKLAIGIVGGLAILGLGAALTPADDPMRYEGIMDACAAAAMILLVLPHVGGWFSPSGLIGGLPGFPFHLHYTRPIRTAVIVALPMVYLTALSSAIYLASALLLRVASGLAFPLLPVAAWMAALTVIALAATWSTHNRTIQLLVMMIAVIRAQAVSVERLTAVELPRGYDWPPRLWPTLFDWPLTDYAWIALIGLASVGVTIYMVSRQRHGDLLADSAVRAAVAASTRPARGVVWDRLVNLFRPPCPTSSATLAQVWMDLKYNGLPVLTIGVAFAIVILLMSAASGPIDAAINANPGVFCPIEECFYVRTLPPMLTALAMGTLLFLGGNAFGILRSQGRANFSTFEATQAHGTAQLAVVKLVVKSACVLTALVALGVGAWISLPLLGDAVFIQMWSVPLSSMIAGLAGGAAALTGYQQLSLLVVAVVGVVIWVASLAVFGALRTRYPRHVNITASSLLLCGLALALLPLAESKGIVSPFAADTIFVTARWIFLAAVVITTAYVFWSGFAERVLTIGYTSGTVAIAAAFGAAWVTVLHMAGVELAGISLHNAIWMVSPALLALMAGGLAPWSLSCIRHT